MPGTILQFMNYQPIIYSGFDRFSLRLAKQLRSSKYKCVFIYVDTMDRCPRLEKDLQDEGIEIVVLNSKDSHLNLFQQIYGLFKKYRPVLTHTHFFDTLKIFVSVCSLLFRVPLITSAHSEITPYYSISERRKDKGYIKNLLFRGNFKFLTYSSEYFFCVSNKIKDQLKTFSWPSNKIQTIYLGVAPPSSSSEKVEIRKKLNLSPNKILLTNVSAIEFIKGIDTIIEALAKLKDDYKLDNFHFYHIGGLRSGEASDPYLEELKKLISDSGLTDHFTWLGIRTDVLDILPAFDIYLHPSRVEGLPVAIMEACAARLPCIGSNISGIPEIISNGENGYIIESEDADQLAFHLNELIENETLRLKMGDHSHEVFSQSFNIETQVGRTKEYYEELIKR